MVKHKHVIKGVVYHYRYIDQGAQYRVYALETVDGTQTGRVIKVPITFEESKRVLGPYLRTLNLSSKEIDQRIDRLMVRKQQLPALLQGIFTEDAHLMGSLGDTKLVPTLVQPKGMRDYFMPLYFTQNFVLPMAEFMHAFRFVQLRPEHITLAHTQQARQLFKAIVRLHHLLWEYGIADTTFKLENIGVLVQGDNVAKAILVDAGEYTFDNALAAAAVNKQKWRYCLDPHKSDHLFLPVILHKLYSEILDRELTADALQRHWQKRSKAIERRKLRSLKMRQFLTRDPRKGLTIWLERQNAIQNLYRGIPNNCIDDSKIPYNDLLLLLNDKHVNKLPLSEIALQEQAERTAYADDNTIMYQIYRDSLVSWDSTQ